MSEAPRVAAVVLAGGSGSRVGADRNKVLLPLDGTPILIHSVRTVLTLPGVHRLVVVVRPEDRAEVEAALQPELGDHDAWVIEGGTERHDSEWHALRALAPDIDSGEIDVVAIHDGARPLAPAALWQSVIDAATHGGAIPVVFAGQLLPSSREMRVAVQTPQAFRSRPLLDAYRRADRDGFRGTDTAACLERYTDLQLSGVESTPINLKVTFPEDVVLAESLLKRD